MVLHAADRLLHAAGRLRDAVVALVSAVQPHGAPDREAATLLALVSGPGDALLLGHQTQTSALATLAHQSARLSPHTRLSPDTGTGPSR